MFLVDSHLQKPNIQLSLDFVEGKLLPDFYNQRKNNQE